MGFMDNLAANPRGSGIYGQVQPTSDQDVLGIVNQLKDRDMSDFKNKANFMADLSLKQDKMRALFDPSKLGGPSQGADIQGGQPNVVFHDPNAMTGFEKNKINLEQQGLGLEKQKLAQNKSLGENAQAIKQQQADLAQQKSDQINAGKQADLQRKIEDADKKLEFARQKLEVDSGNKDKALQAHKDLAAAMEERHKLELENKQHQFDVTSAQHQQQIDRLNEQLKQSGETEQTTEISPDGTKKIVKTKKGGNDTVKVTGKDGKSYMIPKDKVDDWNKNHMPEDQNDQNQDEE